LLDDVGYRRRYTIDYLQEVFVVDILVVGVHNYDPR
jgi:hypothetical protein